MKKTNFFTAGEPDLGQRGPRIRYRRLRRYRLRRRRQVSSLSTLALSPPLFRPSLDLFLSLFSLRDRDLLSLRQKRDREIKRERKREERAGEEKEIRR